MKGKVVVSAVSIILVVGVVIGVVAGVSKYASGANKTSDTYNLNPQMKSVAAICSPTVHKDLCLQTLGKAANNGSADPKALIQEAVLATLNSMKNSITFTSTLNSTKPRVKMAIDDCKEMMDYAVDQLQASLSFVGDNDLHTVNDRVAELQSWLSTVIAYHTSCMEGFEGEDQDLKPEMEKNLQDPKQLTGNVLMILDQIQTVLSTFDIKLDYKANSRRLLSSDKYPTWFSAADRKLLAKVDIGRVVPNAVVAKDGSGQFKTINDALKAYPMGHQGRYIIYVKAGIYDEYVTVDKKMVNVFMYGDGPRKTIVTGNKSHRGGSSTWQSATFSAIGNGFLCKSMGFQNTAGWDGEQAVAFRAQSQNAAFFNCRFDAFQDTLYVQSGRQFFRNCVISGTVDFIFGASQCLIQNSLIIVRKGGDMNAVTAQGASEPGHKTGIVIQNCRVVPDQQLAPVRFQVKTYLGRPWKEYATTVFMESTLGDFIQAEGYFHWNGDETGYFAEYNNRGPGANINGRVKWKGFKGIISRQEALKWTAASPFIDANLWLRETGVPFIPGLRH